MVSKIPFLKIILTKHALVKKKHVSYPLELISVFGDITLYMQDGVRP
jgi:hypothetical protein